MLLDVPSQLSDEKNAEFRALFKRNYQKDISKEEANELAITIMELLIMVIEHTESYHNR